MNYYNPYQRKSFRESIKSFFQSGSVLPILLIVNIGVWVCLCLVFLIAWLYRIPVEQAELAVSNYLALPAHLSKLLVRFWTPFTYMFLHFDFWHILFNMLWLYWFGRIFLEFLSQKKLLLVYLWGGIFGALSFVISYNVFPVFESHLPYSYALGASASIMAIVAAISFYVPHYTLNLLFLGRVKLIWFAIAYLIINLLSIRHGNAGGHIAHLGGALFGIFYAYNLKKHIIEPISIKRIFRRNSKKTYTRTKSARYTDDELYNVRKKQEQEEIDRILDKISKHGYNALTKKEKEILFKRNN